MKGAQAALIAALLIWPVEAAASCKWRPGELAGISGQVDEGDLKGTFTRSVAPASGRIAEAVDLGVVKSGSGFDGRRSWLRDVSGASHYLTSDFALKLGVSEAWLASNLACPAPRRLRGAAHGSITPPGGAPIELWYDRRTGLLDRAMLRYPENRIIHHYADWREVAPGRKYPFLQRDEDPEDESETTYTVRQVGKPAKASFDPPPLPNDSRIAGDSTTIPFEDDNRRRVYLPVYLDGKGPFAFELDNGGHFILTEETAKALGLDPKGSFSSTGAGNQIRQGGYVPIDTLRVGQAEVVRQTAKVLPLSNNDRKGRPPRAGILGLEFFERFIVGVDHRSKTVTLRLISDPARSYPGRQLRLLFDEDAPLVAGGFEGASGNVMLDIGNAGPTIVEHHWATEHGLTARLAAGSPSGSARLSKGTVAVGPFKLSEETVRYFGPGERGSESIRSVAAIIGEPLLSRFNAVYDYGRERVWLEQLPDAPPVEFEKRP